MNLLFYTCGKVNATRGGTERTTITVATSLKNNYGCRCYSLYESDADTDMEECFEGEFYWQIKRNRAENISFLRKIIIDNQIDFIINQGTFIYQKDINEATMGLRCKTIFAHHFEPGWETRYFTFKDLLVNNSSSYSIVQICRRIKNILLFTYLRKKYLTSLHLLYKEAYKYADKVVLLSEGFIEQYQEFGKFADKEKFVIISNGLSFSNFLPIEEIGTKKQDVIIVSRLDERQKRLSLALKIWKEVKKHPIANDWQLKIIGHGQDRNKYEQLVEKEAIKDVLFLGRQNPVSYYKESSIFFMTSISESWGLTLTEAQQFGVVPIAFNTYSSLVDIITDNEDGIVIKEGEVDKYINSVLNLMQNKEERERLAVNGIRNCKRFLQEKIGEKWWNLFAEMSKSSKL